jgi:hypothetical protein
MKTMKLCLVLFLMVTVLSHVGWARKARGKPLIQLAILLDTSGSMQGLIEQAKTQLWNIVNTMATAKRDGAVPKLEVALYEYGKSTIPAPEGYLRQIVPLSEDLDKISEELFKLSTNGGYEYCGQVIQAAVDGLTWSPHHNDYKVIFIAGNEPFTQGKVDYHQSCKTSISKGVIVNTIFCGNADEGIRTQWKDGADLADGQYMNIDHNKKIVHISAPQDKEIVHLGQELNKTYLAYGKGGTAKKERQARQDQNAMAAGEAVMAQRAVTKASGQYRNVGWDLVDAEKEGKVKVEELEEDELPEEMKKMSPKERKAYVEKQKKKREAIQAQISQLKKDRETYVAEKRKEMSDDDTLDAVMVKAIKDQASQKKFKFEKK